MTRSEYFKKWPEDDHPTVIALQEQLDDLFEVVQFEEETRNAV